MPPPGRLTPHPHQCSVFFVLIAALRATNYAYYYATRITGRGSGHVRV